ncbi:dihydrofolate reductase family protein [Tautonia plasticadhaerens]|uniref:Bacterial bifunctional deaminase-reductase C-terminal domain-containing protein n=1 Tax=Tautonia plasticadhaerens TaxID=2527974 RepID=A0A518H3X5_9BACT|nr:hypothetical protein [Tautonia plasticadhaerens]QDV35555.1 hypothetical protein ElP_34580 [Tautonia plasticadhaerens]
MRRLVYYVASTLDGFIAHEDGSFGGFAWDDELVAEFRESLDSFDAVLMGRKTYETCQADCTSSDRWCSTPGGGYDQRRRAA